MLNRLLEEIFCTGGGNNHTQEIEQWEKILKKEDKKSRNKSKYVCN